jgi:choline dehydrogenase
MGTGSEAVVDPAGRLRGIEGLRVADASVLPNTVCGNISASVAMVAEKLSDAIRGRTPLPPSNADYYRAVPA